jgi:hypothetical protein
MHNFFRRKIVSKKLYNFLKTAQSKQSPIGRKFAQSDHPGGKVQQIEAEMFQLQRGTDTPTTRICMHQRSRTVLGCISRIKSCQSSRHFLNADHAPEMVGIVTDCLSKANWLEYFPCLKKHNRLKRIMEHFIQGLSLKYQVCMY